MSIESTAVPPHPPIPEQELSFLGFLRAVRTNALTMWTEAAYQEDVVVRRFLGRSQMLLNAPDAIHRVLIDNHPNYRRSPASIRVLRPITGMGLLLSEGDEWRPQRPQSKLGNWSPLSALVGKCIYAMGTAHCVISSKRKMNSNKGFASRKVSRIA